jgi:hypothetical protein
LIFWGSAWNGRENDDNGLAPRLGAQPSRGLTARDGAHPENTEGFKHRHSLKLGAICRIVNSRLQAHLNLSEMEGAL